MRSRKVIEKSSYNYDELGQLQLILEVLLDIRERKWWQFWK